ncbi:MAG: c-type cytochrome, partial [Terriglobales bacterium]
MTKSITGFIIGIILLPLAAYIMAATGSLPVATASSALPFERRFTKTALHAVLRHQAPRTAPPVALNDATLLAGATVYVTHCAFCHGLADGAATAAAQGMYPPPPQLLQGDGMVTDDPVGVTYWKARNGIRLTGMPGFHASLSNGQLW